MSAGSRAERGRPRTAARRVLRVTVLYPERLNLYADRGNLLVLARRCERRDIACEVSTVVLGASDDIADSRPHLVYIGGGQDRDQRACGADLQRHRETLTALATTGVKVLGICGGYQLLGHEYVTPDGTIPGIGLLDVVTVRGDGRRLVGNAAVVLADGRMLAGFENHQGRTTLGPAVEPLGIVAAGYGNNGEDRTEGAVAGSVIGTYLHGPLLAKNGWFADRLIAEALGIPETELGHLDDRFADAAHRHALAVALNQT